VTRQQLRAHKKLCADVIGNDFDVTNNKFSYTPLKELENKVPKFQEIFAGSPEVDAASHELHEFSQISEA